MHNKITLKDIRYHLEHQLIPSLVSENGASIFAILEEERTKVINDWFSTLCKDNGVHYPYSEKDFAVELHKIDEEIFMINVQMPQPIHSPECHNLFFVISRDFVNQYFTLESSEMDAPFLCSWKGRQHLNYGKITSSEQLVDKIKSIFSENIK